MQQAIGPTLFIGNHRSLRASFFNSHHECSIKNGLFSIKVLSAVTKAQAKFQQAPTNISGITMFSVPQAMINEIKRSFKFTCYLYQSLYVSQASPEFGWFEFELPTGQGCVSQKLRELNLVPCSGPIIYSGLLCFWETQTMLLKDACANMRVILKYVSI